MTTQLDSFDPDDDDAIDRASERRSFFLTSILSTSAHGELTARVRNLSAGGMMVELSETPDPEFRPELRLTAELRNIGRVKGQVAWADGRRFGVRFDREINPELARRPVSAGPTTPDYVKPVLVSSRSLLNAEKRKHR